MAQPVSPEKWTEIELDELLTRLGEFASDVTQDPREKMVLYRDLFGTVNRFEARRGVPVL